MPAPPLRPRTRNSPTPRSAHAAQLFPRSPPQGRSGILWKTAAFTPAACHTGAMCNVRRITSGELPVNSDRILQGNARVGKLVEIRPRPRRNQLAGRHLVLRAVDAVNGDQLARTQVAGAETACCRRAPHYNSVMPLTQPHDDYLQVVLIRPEPRYFVVNRRRTEKIVRSTRRLLERIIDRLQAQAPPVVTVRMIGAVASGIDGRIRCAAVLIHHDAVRALDAGSHRELVGRR